jgi:hypothetical protein
VCPFSLARACYHTDRIAVKSVKKVFGEKYVEAVLQRLDRLTQDEARTTAAETLNVIYAFVQNITAVMNSEQIYSTLHPLCLK